MVEKMSGNASKEPSGNKKNHLMHVLNLKLFVKLFTKKKCTFEDKLIKEILNCICALRNCGGGRLTIWFTETCLMSEAEKCVKIIKNAVDEVLSETRSTDLLEWKVSNRIIFLVSGSKEIVTMKYNIYIMTNEILEFVPSSKSAEDMRLYFNKQNKHPERDGFSVSKQHQVQVNSQKKKRRSTPKKSARSHKRNLGGFHGNVGGPELLNEGEQRKFCQTIKKETKSIVLPERKIERELRLLDQVQLVKGQQFEVSTTKLSQIKFKILEDEKLCQSQNEVVFRITLEKNKLLAYVSAFANHLGGELYYGVSSEGIVFGEKILETEKNEIRKTVETKVATMIWPLRDKKKINEFCTIVFLPVKDQNDFNAELYIITISVKPCHGGVFIHEPESYYVVENRVEILPFRKWTEHLQNSTTELSGGTASIEFKEEEMAFDRIFLPNAYETFLERLEWVESFKIVEKNEECDARHLEIVCRFGEVPRTTDIVKFFGEDILPFITYQKASKREWFETKIFNENWDMKEEYEDKLMSLPWVKEFYIGVASEPEKSWQIYISCAQNNLPSMVDLKKLFGADIASFVDFIQESPDETASFLRGPVSGDEFCVQEDKGGYGTIGILTGDSEKHYATTCYHVCFKKDLPKTDFDGHEILMQDYKNGSQGCQGATCVYTTEQEERHLGQFCHGLYDDNHDIALIELDSNINCLHMVERLEEKNIKPVLATKELVKNMLWDKGTELNNKKIIVLSVEIISPNPTKGKLFALSGFKGCPQNRRCYQIIGKKRFGNKGDSGSLVCLENNGEKIPFAYLCMATPHSAKKDVYYCRNLDYSMKELIKEHRLSNLDIKPCSRECAIGEEVEGPDNDVENDAENEDVRSSSESDGEH